MRLVHRLSQMKRSILLLIVALLLMLEGGLVWAAVHVSQRPATPAAVQGTPPRPGASGAAPTPGAAAPTLAPSSAGIELRPMPREASALVAVGDLAAVAETFDVEEALAHVEELTAPKYAGREAGSPGSRAAAEYLAEQFAAYGLQAAGTDGYYQTFDTPYAEVMAVPVLEYTRADGQAGDELVFREDFAWVWGGYSGGGRADGTVYWLNNGSPSDYRGLDVKGEIVLVRSENAEEAARQALEHGADGLLLLTENQQRIAIRRTYRELPYLSRSLPTLWVSPAVASALLDGSGYTLDDLTFLYRSFELETSARLKVPMKEHGEAPARNVLGVLPGADPALRDQVLILGAHYDHVGLDPEGTIYAGANDNASGVAVLLEIAHSWQAAGYTPERSVLFAAWDAEEQGLFGSQHYVREPSFPLTRTVGMIQLDMVGLAVTGTLTIDSGEVSARQTTWSGDAAFNWLRTASDISDQLGASAEMYGVVTQTVDKGLGSDHTPFLRAGVPAALLIWDDGVVPYYHTPADTLETLQPERLREVGLIVSHTATALASTAPELAEILAEQVAAVRAGDDAALSTSLDPADPALQGAAPGWLASRPAALASSLSVAIDRMSVSRDRATVEVMATARSADESSVTIGAVPLQWVRRNQRWYMTWPVAEVLTGTHAALQVVAPREGDRDRLEALEIALSASAESLDIAEVQPVTATLFPARGALDWLTSDDWPTAGRALLPSEPITVTATSLLLDQLGLPPDAGLWLRVGLTRWLEIDADPELARQRTQQLAADLDPALTANELLDETGERSLTVALNNRAYAAAAWTLVRRLLDEYGPAGLQRLCAAWGAQSDPEAGFAALGTTRAEFAASWEASVPNALSSAREGIATALAQRVRAVLALDRAAFAGTLGADGVFNAEELNWFDSLSAVPALYEADAELLGLEGDSALARVTIRCKAHAQDATVQSVAVMRWQRLGDRWLLADRDWQVRETPHLRVLYSSPLPQLDAWLLAAESVCARVCDDLGYSPGGLISVKLYATEAERRASWPLGVPAWRDDYVTAAEACKLAPVSLDEDVRTLARLVAQRALSERGLSTDWLCEGVATWAGLRAMRASAIRERARYIKAVREAQPFGKLYAWDALPAYDALSEDAVRLYRAQSWLLIDQTVRVHGVVALRDWLDGLERGLAFDRAYADATGTTWAAWEANWPQLAATGGVPDEWLSAAQSFAVPRAQADVARLAAADLAGRRAGSAGGAAAGEWLVEQFQTIGLEPGASDGSFIQTVTVDYSELGAPPTLRVSNPATGERLELGYLERWGDLVGGAAGGGEASGGVVWISRQYADGMRFGGRIVLKRQEDEPLAEAEQALAHGAGGLLLVRRFYSPWQRESPATANVTDTLPVAIISEDTWQALVTMAGLTTYQANTAPPATLLPLAAELRVPHSAVRSAPAPTIVGKLAGSDPTAPALVLAANYDGSGNLPDGTWYPSANRNAAGVAVLLEVARVLRATGQQPRSTVYLVAWGAEQAGLASSRALADSPIAPVTQTLGVLNLDTVGASDGYYLTLAGTDAHEGPLLSSLLLAGDLLSRRVTSGRTELNSLGTDEVLRGLGYPTVQLFWPDARNLNTPLDTPDTLQADKLATTGEVVALASLLLAW